MKTLFCCLFVTLLVNACSSPTSSNTGNGSLTATFTLTDSTGKRVNQLHSGETFVLSFMLINSTKDTLISHDELLQPVIFRILESDSTVASSIDGFVFQGRFQGWHLAPRDSLQHKWIASTTPPKFYSEVVLRPGTYTATVTFPNFQQGKVNPVSPIIFFITQ